MIKLSEQSLVQQRQTSDSTGRSSSQLRDLNKKASNNRRVYSGPQSVDPNDPII